MIRIIQIYCKRFANPPTLFFTTGLVAWWLGGLFASLLGCKVSLYLLKHIGLKKYWKFYVFFGQNPQNSLKIAQWQVPGHSWVPFLTTGRLLERPQGPWLRSTTCFLASFRSPWTPQKSTKNRSLAKKEVPGINFNAVSSQMSFFSLRDSIFIVF